MLQGGRDGGTVQVAAALRGRGLPRSQRFLSRHRITLRAEHSQLNDEVSRRVGKVDVVRPGAPVVSSHAGSARAGCATGSGWGRSCHRGH